MHYYCPDVGSGKLSANRGQRAAAQFAMRTLESIVVVLFSVDVLA